MGFLQRRSGRRAGGGGSAGGSVDAAEAAASGRSDGAPIASHPVLVRVSHLDEDEPQHKVALVKHVCAAAPAGDDDADAAARDDGGDRGGGKEQQDQHEKQQQQQDQQDHEQRQQQQQHKQHEEQQQQHQQQRDVFLDEEALLAAQRFPIPPGELVRLAREVVAAGVHRCGRLSNDFTFSAPFVGPMGADECRRTMERLDLDAAFPDLAPRCHHFRCDPLLPGRVWFTTWPTGTNTGPLTAAPVWPAPPSGRRVESPPQTASLTFNAAGEVSDWTMGYVMDRRLGNTGGLGGAFGLLWAAGLAFPFPEGRPWASSWQQRLFNSGSPLLQVAAFLADRLASALLPGWLATAHARNTP